MAINPLLQGEGNEKKQYQRKKVRIAYEYSPGSYAYIVNKYLQRNEVLEVFTNGTVKLQRVPVAQIINIRRLTPTREVTSTKEE